MVKPRTGKASPFPRLSLLIPLPWGGGTEQPLAPRCQPHCARNGQRMSCGKAGRVCLAQSHWGGGGADITLPLPSSGSVSPTGSCFTLVTCLISGLAGEIKERDAVPVLRFPGVGCCGSRHQLCPFSFAPVIPAVPRGTGPGSRAPAERLPGACFRHRRKKRRPAPAVWD